jgi:hypothetical protein
LHIIFPRFGSDNPRFMEKSERERLEHLVEQYRTYGLRFVRGTEDQYGAHQFELDPPIYQLVLCPELSPPFPPVVQCQTIQGLLDKHRRAELVAPPTSAPPTVRFQLPDKAQPIIPTAPEVQRDFFGRTVAAASATTLPDDTPTSSSTPVAKSTPVVGFKFHEGATNAIRRNIAVRMLR